MHRGIVQGYGGWFTVSGEQPQNIHGGRAVDHCPHHYVLHGSAGGRVLGAVRQNKITVQPDAGIAGSLFKPHRELPDRGGDPEQREHPVRNGGRLDNSAIAGSRRSHYVYRQRYGRPQPYGFFNGRHRHR